MNTHRTATDLGAVEHEVVSPGLHIARRRLDCFRVGNHWRRERMMGRGPTLVTSIPLKQWKIDDPKRPPARLDKTAVLP